MMARTDMMTFKRMVGKAAGPTSAKSTASLPRARQLARVAVGCVLGMSVLSGCALMELGAGEPARMFVITPVAVDSATLPYARAAVTIKEPYAAAEVNTPKILYRPTAHEVVYIGEVRWSDTAPVIFQTALIDTFEQSGKFDAVARTGSGLRAQYEVQTELREFGFIQRDGTMVASVDLRVSLVDMHKGRLVATTRFASEAASKGKTQDDLVLALDSASDDVMSHLTVWAVQTLSGVTPANLSASIK